MLILYLEKFLQKHYSYQKPVLLGYSGGSDSEALLQLLLEVRKKKPFELHLVHVDHGWRKTSTKESEELHLKAKALGLPFHLARQPSSYGKGNQEQIARNFRYAYFAQLQEKYGFEAIFLAHHADDLAETVLKRILEGAHLFNVGGMKPCSFFQGGKLFRPLLPFSKKELLGFLQEKKSSFIVDASNEDLRFLRARFRKKLFPLLQEQFGKNPTNPLQFVARQTWELKEHLDQKLAPLLAQRKCTPFFQILSIDPSLRFSTLEWRSLLYQFFEGRLSREQEEHFLEAIQQKRECLSLEKTYFWEQNTLYWKTKEIPLLQGTLFQEGLFVGSNWQILVEKMPTCQTSSDWRDWLEGSFHVYIPPGKYEWDTGRSSDRVGGKSLREFYREKKVPSFLRGILPLLRKEDKVEWQLTGSLRLASFEGISSFWKVTITIKTQ